MQFYGGLKPMRVIGRDQFARHDAASTWDDGGVATELAADAIREIDEQIAGAVEAIKQRFSEDLARYGAHQVRDAVVDYVSNGYLDIAVVDGKLCICFDASNDQAQMVAAWDLALLLRRAGNEALNKQDAATYGALADLVNALPAAPVAQSVARAPVDQSEAAPIGRRPKGVVRNREVRSMA